MSVQCLVRTAFAMFAYLVLTHLSLLLSHNITCLESYLLVQLHRVDHDDEGGIIGCPILKFYVSDLGAFLIHRLA